MPTCSPWVIAYPYIVARNLADLRRDGLLTDLSIVAGGEIFQVHKVVLAASSPYFRAMLTNQMAETFVSTLEISDVAEEILEQVLSFMYSGEATVDSLHQAILLIAASEKFLMTDLSNIIFQSVKERAMVANCPELLAEAKRLGLRDLEAFASTRCLEHFEELVKTDAFLALPPPVLLDLVDSDFLMAPDEEMVVLGAVEWIEATAAGEAVGDRGNWWRQIFPRLRFGSVDPCILPRLWPRLAPHCTDLATCTALLWGFARVPGAGTVATTQELPCTPPDMGRGPRWLARTPGNEEEQLEMAQQLFSFATGSAERGQLSAALLVRKNDKKIQREVVNLTQSFFETVVSERREAKHDGNPRGELFLVADLMVNMVYHKLLAATCVRDRVLEELHGLDTDEARMQLCTLGHGLMRVREEVANGTTSEVAVLTIQRLMEIAELELNRTKSPWLKLELRKAVQELRK